MIWDAIAAIGNLLIILAFGAATLKALRRFKNRFVFNFTPEGELITIKKGEGITR